jgi:lysophospholipase L1-like esterase
MTAPLPVIRHSAARVRARVLLFLSATVSVLVLVELLLQGAALAVWWAQRPPTNAMTREVVLCIGDSWTQGMGSSDLGKFSYPAILDGILRDSVGAQWSVINGGLSGLNSRDVLERLPSQLRQFTPRVVCILVGQNDYWTRPQPLPKQHAKDTPQHGFYRFRWRLPRLVPWALGNFFAVAQVQEHGRQGEEWLARPPKLERAYRKTKSDWQFSPEAQPTKEEGWQQRARGDREGALRSFLRVLELAPEDGQAHQALAVTYSELGKRAPSQQHLDWLRNSYAATPGYWFGSSLVAALEGCGIWQEARDLLPPLLERFPEDGVLWRQLANMEFFLGNHEAALAAAERAVSLWPEAHTFLTLHKIHFLGRKDSAGAIDALFAGYLAVNDAEWLESRLRSMAKAELLDLAVQRATAFPAEPPVSQRIQQIAQDARRSLDGAEASLILSQHLARMAVEIRESGARPVFLTYPVHQQAEAVLRETAAELNLPFLEVRSLFQQQLGQRKWEQLRAPDGHCNDEGYRLMASVIAAGLQPILQQANK